MPNPKRTGLSDNFLGATAYFTPFMAFFLLAIRRYNKRPYVRFHAWQSLLFELFSFTFGYLLFYVLPIAKFIGLRVWIGLICLGGLAVSILWLWCVMSALSGKRFKLPLIGAWADEQAYR